MRNIDDIEIYTSGHVTIFTSKKGVSENPKICFTLNLKELRRKLRKAIEKYEDVTA